MNVIACLRVLATALLTGLTAQACAVEAERPALAAEDNPLATDREYTVAGLTGPGRIVVDRWGVPHLYAEDHYDVFFLQGFNAARDRLWQIDLWRRRGLGQLSEVLGAAYVDQDEAARLFLYRSDMYSEWLAYGNDAKLITERFVSGINAFVTLTQRFPELRPPEFDLLGYEPAYWQPEDVVRIRSNGLWRNVASEVWFARWACAGALDAAQQWRTLQPAWETRVPEGLDPCVVPADVLNKYFLAKAPVSFNGLQAAAGAFRHELIAQSQALSVDPSIGSNNWVVHGTRTATGRPILADDPHRSHATPSLRYIAHLKAPGIDVIGAGEPALPGISIGHNHRIAFGLTIFPIDQEDLYVYEKAGDGYRYQNRVEAFVEEQATLHVKDVEKPVTRTLRFTRHGPVVAETDQHAFAVRAAWLEPGMSPYFGSIEYMRAENFREFVGALNRWGAPSENQVYADIDGHIGYKPAGRFPRRNTWDGVLPVPGDGRYEWDGYFDMDALPEEYNPPRGFTGTANSMNLPPSYPIDERRIGFEWSAPWRYERLWEVLKADQQHTLAASTALQRDYHSVLAREVLALLPDLDAHPGGTLLAGWDQRLSANSGPAALWVVWYARHLTPALGALVQPTPPSSVIGIDTHAVLRLLATPRGRDTAYASLATAYAHTRALLGEDPTTWRWGDVHQIAFRHPLRDLAPAALQQQMAMAAYPRGGSANTTNNTRFGAADFEVRGGASFRMVVDVGNWDAATATNAPGQAGDPRSPFYDNLLENWATEGDFPLLYSDEAVAEATAFTIRLVPPPRPVMQGTSPR